MADRRLIDANALRGDIETEWYNGNMTEAAQDRLLALIGVAPTVVPDDARLRAIIWQRFVDQGADNLGAANAIALAVDDIMEYLGAKATDA